MRVLSLTVSFFVIGGQLGGRVNHQITSNSPRTHAFNTVRINDSPTTMQASINLSSVPVYSIQPTTSQTLHSKDSTQGTLTSSTHRFPSTSTIGSDTSSIDQNNGPHFTAWAGTGHAYKPVLASNIENYSEFDPLASG